MPVQRKCTRILSHSDIFNEVRIMVRSREYEMIQYRKNYYFLFLSFFKNFCQNDRVEYMNSHEIFKFSTVIYLHVFDSYSICKTLSGMVSERAPSQILHCCPHGTFGILYWNGEIFPEHRLRTSSSATASWSKSRKFFFLSRWASMSRGEVFFLF